MFKEGGIRIIVPTPTAAVESAGAKVKLCTSAEEARDFVKGFKAVDIGWFVWGQLFL